MNPHLLVVIVLVVVNVISIVGVLAGVLSHAGQGDGLSNLLGSGAAAAASTSGGIRNLGRVTVMFIAAWVMSSTALSMLLG